MLKEGWKWIALSILNLPESTNDKNESITKLLKDIWMQYPFITNKKNVSDFFSRLFLTDGLHYSSFYSLLI